MVLAAVPERDAGRAAVLRDDVVDRRLELDLDPERGRGTSEDLGEPAIALLVERPRPELAVVLAEQVVEQHEPGALRVRPDPRADDRGRGHVALEDVRLEVVVEEVRRRAGEQPDRVVEDLPVQLPEARAQRGQADQLLGVVAPEVGRRLVHQRLDGLEDLGDVVVERVVRVRVVLRVPRDLLVVLAVVLPEEQVVAVLLRAEGRRHQDRHEAVLHELELVDDVRAEQAQGVRERREPEARAELLGDRRAADIAAPLEHERAQAGLREVRRVRHPVVACADDDRVVRPRLAVRVGLRGARLGPVAAFVAVGLRHRQAVLRCGLNRGSARHVRVEVLVAMAHRHLELDARAGRRPVERDAGQRDVALEHRRVHLARRVAELVQLVVVDVVLVLERRVVLGRDEPRAVVDPVVVPPVDDEPGELPARGLVAELAPDRVARR